MGTKEEESLDSEHVIALVAHDSKKPDMVAFAVNHREQLKKFKLVSTGTTGNRILESCPELEIDCVKSGPLGGDQQIGAMIANEKVSALIFFIDAMSPMPHDVDVKALLRLGVLYDIPMALNVITAELLLSNRFVSSKITKESK